jgi:hypothetical protein
MATRVQAVRTLGKLALGEFQLLLRVLPALADAHGARQVSELPDGKTFPAVEKGVKTLDAFMLLKEMYAYRIEVIFGGQTRQ